MADRLICLAHRGASGHAPENTLAAFRKAVELGADWIELDVYAVQNELLVIHDSRLERTTSGHGYVSRRRLDYLRQLDAGDGEKIPFLREVLDETGRRIKINIELKGPNTAGPVCDLIEHYVKDRGWYYDDFLLSSFARKQIRDAKIRCPEIRIGLNLDAGRIRYAAGKEPPLYSIHIKTKHARPSLIENIHRRGCLVFVFTVNRAEDIKKMQHMGVDGVFTNFPELITGAG